MHIILQYFPNDERFSKSGIISQALWKRLDRDVSCKGQSIRKCCSSSIVSFEHKQVLSARGVALYLPVSISHPRSVSVQKNDSKPYRFYHTVLWKNKSCRIMWIFQQNSGTPPHISPITRRYAFENMLFLIMYILDAGWYTNNEIEKYAKYALYLSQAQITVPYNISESLSLHVSGGSFIDLPNQY